MRDKPIYRTSWKHSLLPSKGNAKSHKNTNTAIFIYRLHNTVTKCGGKNHYPCVTDGEIEAWLTVLSLHVCIAPSKLRPWSLTGRSSCLFKETDGCWVHNWHFCFWELIPNKYNKIITTVCPISPRKSAEEPGIAPRSPDSQLFCQQTQWLTKSGCKKEGVNMDEWSIC